MSEVSYRTVTPETLGEDRERLDSRIRVGDTVRVDREEVLDLRLFGQLRTWLGDPPKPENLVNVNETYYYRDIP